MAEQVKFQKHRVVKGDLKARVFYSTYFNDRLGCKVVSVYAKDYDRNLGRIIPDLYKNDTDTQVDYFDQGSITIPAGHPLYAEALARAEANAS